VDFRKQPKENAFVHIERTAVEKVESFKFHTTDNKKWLSHTDSVVKKE
jgi:hypothetical protein